MEQEKLGTGYFRFNLPDQPEEKEVARINRTFDQVVSSSFEQLNVRERLTPSKHFWNLYHDCFRSYSNDGTFESPVIHCSSNDARFLHTVINAFTRAHNELKDSESDEEISSIVPALVNAYLRGTVSKSDLNSDGRYIAVQNKDRSRGILAFAAKLHPKRDSD